MAQIVRHQLLNYAGIPLERRLSVLAKQHSNSLALTGEVVIKIVFIVRYDSWKGRMILNHHELIQGFEELAKSYPEKLLRDNQEAPKLKFETEEHLANTSMPDTWKMFGSADLVIGPHGAGTSNPGIII